MKMAFISRVGLGLAAALVVSGSAFAASVAPPNYPFTLKGGGNLNKSPNIIWPCGWTLQAQTTSSSGGTISGGTGDTNNNCNKLSVGPATWSVTSDTAGIVHGLSINGPNISCSGDVPFTITKSGNQITSFFFNSASFGNGCNFNANLNTGAALTVTP